MKKSIITILLIVLTFPLFAQPDNNIYLLVRADDIGSFHAANVACIESYQNGIARSVELWHPAHGFPNL